MSQPEIGMIMQQTGGIIDIELHRLVFKLEKITPNPSWCDKPADIL